MLAASLLPTLLNGHVLVVGAPPKGAAPETPRFDIAAPSTLGELKNALATGPERFDAALICDWSRDVSLTNLVVEVRRAVRGGGRVAFVAPIAHGGWRGARGALIGVFRRRRPVVLEALCNALLLGGCTDVRARPLEDAAGLHVVWARAPSGMREDVETSTIRSTGLS